MCARTDKTKEGRWRIRCRGVTKRRRKEQRRRRVRGLTRVQSWKAQEERSGAEGAACGVVCGGARVCQIPGIRRVCACPPSADPQRIRKLCCVFTPAIVSLHRSPALLEVSPLVSLVLGEVGLLDPLRHVSAHERARGARHGRARESARSTSKEITSSLSIGKPSMTPLWG